MKLLVALVTVLLLMAAFGLLTDGFAHSGSKTHSFLPGGRSCVDLINKPEMYCVGSQGWCDPGSFNCTQYCTQTGNPPRYAFSCSDDNPGC